MEKVVLISLHQKRLGLAVMGKYHSILLMLFNLAFLMKCKYDLLKTFLICMIGKTDIGTRTENASINITSQITTQE